MAGKDAGRTWTRRQISLLALAIALGPAAVNWHSAYAQNRARDRPQNRQQRPPQKVKQATANPTAGVANSNSDVVAVVNHQTITRAQLAKECIRRYGEEVLESEVNKRLILDACRTKNIKITAGEIEAEIERMAGKFGLSTDRWIQMLQEERKITANQYRRDIVWPTLALRRLSASQTRVTDEELQKGYEAEFGPSVQVRMVSARSSGRAEELLAKARANPDKFDVLAKDESEDENSAATRGLIPPIHKHVGDPKVTQAAFALRPGEISPIIETAGQFLILKCERHLPPRKLTDEQRQQAMERLKDTLEDRKLRLAAAQMFKALQRDSQVVNVYNNPDMQDKMPGVAATVKGRKITMAELGEQCIVRHGELVLDGEINRALLTQALKRRSQQVAEADLQEEIRRAAASFGFATPEGTVDVDRWLKKVTEEGSISVDAYVRDAVWPTVALKKLVSANVQVSEEDLRKGFRANYGERVEVLAIVLSSQRTAHEVFDLARKNPTEKFFGELAQQYSIEPVSRANYGQVPPIRQFGGQPLIEQEAFKLKPGEISGVLAAGDKFIILRCLGRTKPIVEDMAVVKEELEKDIREKKQRIAMTREFDRLKERSQVDNFLSGTSSGGQAPQGQPVSFTPSQSQTRPREANSKASLRR